ncbi:MAG: carboxypeptidase-like regulatory domain-containing protein, partial [Candidatus Hydrogenedentota bacterium]
MTRRHESTSFRTSVIVIGFSILSLFIFITLSNFLAPEKPDAPVGSIITFESPPPLDAPQFDFDAIPASYDAKNDDEDAEPPKKIFHDENFAVVTGTITDIATGKPIANATIKAQWERSEEEVLAFNEYRETLRDENSDDSDDTIEDDSDDAIDPEDLQELEDLLGADRFEDFEEFLNIDDLLLEPNSEHSDHQITHSDVDGNYTIYVPYDRLVVLGFSAVGYVPVTREDLVFSREEEYAPLDITLSRGASVAGRIYNIGTNEGILGMFLDIDPDSSPNSHHAHVSDENGTYVISGLVPGQFDLKIEHRNTRFKPGKVLPFQRITIDHDSQEITGVDFGLTRAGIVWGYTRAPQDDSPVQANLLLVGTENMITQGINAAMSEFKETQAVFATYSDTENDGYYELAGVPLDKEWRVFAMSNDRAPQLSDSFVLTASSPDIRVDINLLNGSDVYGRVVDEDGYPVEGAELFCMPGFTEFFAPLGSAKVFRDATSDEDGNFVLNDLPSGSYKIFSFKQGYKITARGTSIFPDGQFDITGIVVELHAATSGEHIIYGIVTDRDGQPVSGAELNMMGFSMDSILSDGDPGGENTTTTNQYGEYLYEGVSLGKYIININKEGFSPRTIAQVWLDKPTDIILGGGALISGTVYVRETDRPFDGSFTISANPEVALTLNGEKPLQIFENITNQTGQTFTDTNGEF